MIAAFSVDHNGCTGNGRKNAGDYGAVAGKLTEVHATRIVAFSAVDEMHRLKHVGIPITHDDYAERHAWANRNGVETYVAEHFNGFKDPTVSRGLYFYDPRSKHGPTLARMLAEATAELYSEILGKPYDCQARAATRPEWVDPYYTIKGLSRPIGICSEPGFISNPEFRAKCMTAPALVRLGQIQARVIIEHSSLLSS
jgi:N-acetylmuramoyl-L-alanine amidase